MLKDYIYINNTTTKGRGVFTNSFIAKDTLIEIAPVIIMQKNDREHLDKTLLHDYIFEWGIGSTECCMALGYVPIYNHSYKSRPRGDNPLNMAVPQSCFCSKDHI